MADRYALIDNVSNAWMGGPFDRAPTATAAQRVIICSLFYPDAAYWSAANGGGWVSYQSEAQCLAQVDAQAGALAGTVLTIAPGRSDLYRRKQAEIDKASTLAGTTAGVLSALNLLTVAQRTALYPLLSIEMDVMGFANLGQAYSYISAAIATANARLNAIEAARRAAKMAIRAAPTIAAKNAAAGAITWPA